MSTATISIQLDSDAVQFYESATFEQRQKIQLLISALMRECGQLNSTSGLFSLMDEISDQAQAKGLTPTKLQALLDEE